MAVEPRLVVVRNGIDLNAKDTSEWLRDDCSHTTSLFIWMRLFRQQLQKKHDVCTVYNHYAMCVAIVNSTVVIT